jgi:hypothetical protein
VTVSELEQKMSLSEFTGWLAYLEEKNRQIKNGGN